MWSRASGRLRPPCWLGTSTVHSQAWAHCAIRAAAAARDRVAHRAYGRLLFMLDRQRLPVFQLQRQFMWLFMLDRQRLPVFRLQRQSVYINRFQMREWILGGLVRDRLERKLRGLVLAKRGKWRDFPRNCLGI